MAMRVLVVIDMQTRFPAARDSSLVTAVEAAAAAADQAVLLGWDGSGGWTVRSGGAIPALWKQEADGGELVYSWLVGAGLIAEDLIVTLCGVNLSHCVFLTARTLAARLCREHQLCDHVVIDLDATGDFDEFRVRFEHGHGKPCSPTTSRK